MNKYFKTSSELYEQIRNSMDSASGYPNNQAETWFISAEQAPKDSEGNCLIAAIEPIAEEFLKAGAEELTEEQYQALLPSQNEEQL